MIGLRQRQREAFVVGEERILDDPDALEADPEVSPQEQDDPSGRWREDWERQLAELEQRLAQDAAVAEQRLLDLRGEIVDEAVAATRTEQDEALERLGRTLRAEAKDAHETLVAETARLRPQIEQDVEARIEGATAAAVAELERRSDARLGERLTAIESQVAEQIAVRVDDEVERACADAASDLRELAQGGREALVEAGDGARNDLIAELERLRPVEAVTADEAPRADAVESDGGSRGWLSAGGVAATLAVGSLALALALAGIGGEDDPATSLPVRSPGVSDAHVRRSGAEPSNRDRRSNTRRGTADSHAPAQPDPVTPALAADVSTLPAPATTTSPPPAASTEPAPEPSAPASVADVQREFGP